MIITIDGPSGSGKTTLALMVAQHLHFFCMNSGYLYRGLAYVLKTYYSYDLAKIESPDLADIAAIFSSGNFRYEYDQGLVKIYWIDNITPYLKDPEISKFAATIARHDGARQLLRQYERSLVDGKDTVIEGRACGSAVYPHADIKFYVDASPQLRASRLQLDQLKRGKVLNINEALTQIKMRDDMDKTRAVEPLAIPEGAVVLDSTKTNADELLQQALNVIGKFLKK